MTIFEAHRAQRRLTSPWMEAAMLVAAIVAAPLAFVVGLVVYIGRGRSPANRV